MMTTSIVFCSKQMDCIFVKREGKRSGDTQVGRFGKTGFSSSHLCHLWVACGSCVMQGVASLVKHRMQAAASGNVQHLRPMLLFPEVRTAEQQRPRVIRHISLKQATSCEAQPGNVCRGQQQTGSTCCHSRQAPFSLGHLCSRLFSSMERQGLSGICIALLMVSQSPSSCLTFLCSAGWCVACMGEHLGPSSPISDICWSVP